MSEPRFVISSFCHVSGCVAVAMQDDRILVRDTKIDDGPVLAFTRAEWTAFLAGVRAGEFDPVGPLG